MNTARRRLLVFGGVYGNLHALERLHAIAHERSIDPHDVVCTGDIAAYCADPEACYRLIRDWEIHCISGNVEQQLAAEGDCCGCNFQPGTTCDVLSAAWWRYCSERVSAETRRWMATLPDRLILELGDTKVGFTHGSPTMTAEFLFESSPWETKAAHLDHLGVSVMVGGHCGLPFVSRQGTRLWLNSGALGMPANDGTTRGWYAVLHATSPRELTVEIEPLSYDWRAAQRSMRAAGLPEPYASALETGLWPSLDILPPEERELTGRPIRPFAKVLSDLGEPLEIRR
jgi:predicted phosphodiesterase